MRVTTNLFALIVILWIGSGLFEKTPPPPEPVQLSVEPEAVVLPPEPVEEITMKRISAYNPVPRQTTADPSTSSCGPTLPRQIAVSRDYFFDENGRKHL